MKVLLSICVWSMAVFYTGINAIENLDDQHSKKLTNLTEISSRDAGQIKFEDDQTAVYPKQDSDTLTFSQSNRYQLEANPTESKINSGKVTFHDDNQLGSRRKRRRRRRPKYQHPMAPAPLITGPQYPQGPVNPGIPYPGSQGPPLGFGPGVPVPQNFRPQRRPKPSLASSALSAVTGALTSIATYDDLQCVPRLLCEAAGGSGYGANLPNVAGLQPLLTLLSAYSGISSSPLFLFGRAVFLGMTSKGNAASCRYAYSQCPTDTEQLVHYLNNHNGGFFRFFNNPQNQQQNLQQFYNQLSSYQQNIQNPLQEVQDPNYQQSPQQYHPNAQENHQGYGFQIQSPGQPSLPYPNYPQQNSNYYGLYNQPQNSINNQPTNGQSTSNYYGLHNQLPNYGPNHLSNGNIPHYYGKNYAYNNNFGQFSAPNGIQKRIQNNPNHKFIDYDVKEIDAVENFSFPEGDDEKQTEEHDIFEAGEEIYSTHNLSFPESNKSERTEEHATFQTSKALKFPEDISNNGYYDRRRERNGKSIKFPESLASKYTRNPNSNGATYNKYNNRGIMEAQLNAWSTLLGNISNNYKKYNDFSDKGNKNDDDGLETVYIVRGNGDPNYPEIVKVRPNQRVN